MSEICLLRHGAVQGGACFRGSTDDELSCSGWRQMWRATRRQGPWDRIISSPLRRCARFATRLARRLDLPLHCDPRLREMHFGAWEGKTAAQLLASDAPALQAFWSDPQRFPPPQAESLDEFARRVDQCWQDLQAMYAGQRLLCITHGGVIRVLLCRQQGLPLQHTLQFDVAYGELITLRTEPTPAAIAAGA